MNEHKDRSGLWTRREVIARVSAMLGGATLVGQAAMLAGCAEDRPDQPGRAIENGLFTEADIELLNEIAETILPETATPGAREADVGAFIAVMVTDAYSPDEQATIMDGLATIDRLCREEYGDGFMGLDADQRLALATRLDREQHDAARNGEPKHYFRMLKELAVLGFFSSEVAYKHILEYAETPGRYEACRTLDDSVRMMAGHAASLSSN